MTLANLKAQAADLNLSDNYVRHFGPLGQKATWEAAITAAKAPRTAPPGSPRPMDTAAAPVLVAATAASALGRLLRGKAH